MQAVTNACVQLWLIIAAPRLTEDVTKAVIPGTLVLQCVNMFVIIFIL
jgi:hypothetical protein